MVRWWMAGVLALTGLLAPLQPVLAHRPSDAYLTLVVTRDSLEGSWAIALRDLDHALGLDADLDGAITWGELRARHPAIAAFALARLRIETGAGPCPTNADEQLVDRRSDGGYAVLRFTAACPGPVESLRLGYELLFDLDPLHRGLVQVEGAGETHTTIFSPQRRSWSLEIASPDLWRQFSSYLIEGVWHIWIGFDHILFLISLLLPAVQRFEARQWKPRGSLREAFLEVAKIVTAFTIAHSVTLGLAVLGWVEPPSALVEAVIAASIVLAALNNIRPLVTRRLWALAFGFGLVHGFGFAGVLQELGLPANALATSLVGFNLGVEAGQLAIVALTMPIAFSLRGAPLYPRLVLRMGSLLIAAVAALWLVERTFGITLMT